MKKDNNFRFYWEETPRRKKGDGSIRMGIPGFGKDEINVKIEDGILNISAEKKSHKKEKGRGFYREEVSFSSFSRSVSLPEGAKHSDFDISVEDGAVRLKRKKRVKV